MGSSLSELEKWLKKIDDQRPEEVQRLFEKTTNQIEKYFDSQLIVVFKIVQTLAASQQYTFSDFCSSPRKQAYYLCVGSK